MGVYDFKSSWSRDIGLADDDQADQALTVVHHFTEDLGQTRFVAFSQPKPDKTCL